MLRLVKGDTVTWRRREWQLHPTLVGEVMVEGETTSELSASLKQLADRGLLVRCPKRRKRGKRGRGSRRRHEELARTSEGLGGEGVA